MENFPSISEQPLSNLTTADLEILITKIVKKVIEQETQKQQIDPTVTRTQDFLNTFGSWEDTRSTQEIVDDIYASRTVGE
jgi:hypothetical protein